MKKVWSAVSGRNRPAAASGQHLRLWMNGHRHDITHKRIEDSPVAAHFNHGTHSLADMTLMVIDLVSRHERKVRKSRWIRTLGTSFPSGMNLMVDSL